MVNVSQPPCDGPLCIGFSSSYKFVEVKTLAISNFFFKFMIYHVDFKI